MAKDQAQSDIIDLARWTHAIFDFNRTASPQLKSIVQVQESLAEELGSFARNWFQRRYEATETTFKTLHEINAKAKDDPAAAVQAITEWQRGSFERLNADLQDWTTLCMRCADGAMTAQSVVKSGDTDLDRSGKTNSKTAPGAAGKLDGKEPPKSKSKSHATPV